MSDRYIDFMVSATGAAPRTLHESIRLLGNASSGFCRSWGAGDYVDAEATSQEAFGLLDHIQNELLRRRDDRRNEVGWQGSALQIALAAPVGSLVEPTTPAIEAAFKLQPVGNGAIPAGCSLQRLKLADALNKLKHRSSNTVNFTSTEDGSHQLVILTLAGSGRPNSLSSFEVRAFCAACRMAAGAVCYRDDA